MFHRLRSDRAATDPILVIAAIAASLTLLVAGTFTVKGTVESNQQSAAKNDLAALAAAESAWQSSHGTFITYSDLGDDTLANGSAPLHPTSHLVANGASCGWVAAAKTKSGAVFVRTSASPTIMPAPATSLTIPSCFPADAITSVLASVNIPSLRSVTIKRIAGQFDVAGKTNGTGLDATFNYPDSLSIGPDGSAYVADSANNLIRKVTQSGVVTTYAGNGISPKLDGPAASAQFNSPGDTVVDGAGTVYVAEAGNRNIRKITTDGTVTTLAGSTKDGYVDGPSTSMQTGTNFGMTFGPDGDIYFTDNAAGTVRHVTLDGTTTTYAGPVGTSGIAAGPVGSTGMVAPTGLAFDHHGDLFIVDRGSHRVFRSSNGGVPTPWLGSGTAGTTDGTGTAASLWYPWDVIAGPGDVMYVADYGNIRRILNGVASATIGSTPTPDQYGQTGFRFGGMGIDAGGNIWVADFTHDVILQLGAWHG